MYLHRQCIPLEMVDLEAQAKKEADKKATPLFALLDCGEGSRGRKTISRSRTCRAYVKCKVSRQNFAGTTLRKLS